MAKTFMNQFDDNLFNTVLMHPSSWTFSWLTKNVQACSIVTGLVVSAIAFLNAILGAPFILTWFLAMSFFWLGYLASVIIRSRRIIKKNYNQYLYPIEVAFNSMRFMDQKKYSDMLTDAYAICARNDYDEYKELEKIRELFELTAPRDNVVSLDTELEKKRAEHRIHQENDKMMKDILNGLKEI